MNTSFRWAIPEPDPKAIERCAAPSPVAGEPFVAEFARADIPQIGQFQVTASDSAERLLVPRVIQTEGITS